MAWAKQLWLEAQEYEMEQALLAGYEEAQSRLRMSCLCRDSVRPLQYPLWLRIVELARASQRP